MKRVYLDNSATTAVDPAVVTAMVEYMTDKFGNPSSIHAYGREVRKGVEEARAQVAQLISAEPREIIFTSGGTEADNLAIKGAAFANRKKGNHIITTAIEHHAVLHTCEKLEKQGFEVTYLPVDENAQISVEALQAAIRPETILVTVMFANNEVGTVLPIAKIGQLCREKGILFHTDAVQAAGNIPVDVKELQVDLLSLSGHKIHGPKGSGALYIRKGVRLEPQQHGGSQERNIRPGTENVPGIIGLGKAAELARLNLDAKIPYVTALRDKLIAGIEASIPYVKLNGHPVDRLPGNVNFSFRYVEGESLLLNLDLKGIAASSGSACTSGSLDPSHVLLAMGLSHEVAHGSLRLSLGGKNTEEDIDYCLEILPPILERLRSMSPLSACNELAGSNNPCGSCQFHNHDHHHGHAEDEE